MVFTRVVIVEAAPKTEESAEWLALLQATASATGRPVYSGRQQEDESQLWMLSDWPSAESFAQARDIQQHLTDTTTRTATKVIASYTINLTADQHRACAAPTTEISIGFFRPAVSDTTTSGLERAIRDFTAKAEAIGAPGRPEGVVGGWTVERDVDFKTLAGEPAQGPGFFSLMGWQSRAAHYAFNETDFVQQNAGAIANAGVEGWLIVHFAFAATPAS